MTEKWKVPHRLMAVLVTVLVLAMGSFTAAAFADEEEKKDDGSIDKVVAGVQGTSVDSDANRPGRFNRYRDAPSGFVVDYMRFAHRFGDDGKSYFDIKAVDPVQNDERYRIKLGVGDKLRLRFNYAGVPVVLGNGARTLLGGSGAEAYRIADFIQRAMEDPDGNGVPFYAEPGGPGGDNALVQGMTNDLLTGASPFDLTSKSRLGILDLGYQMNSNWRFGVDYSENRISGLHPLGSGTYQRVTDVNGDGSTDYDYFFSVRGVELAAPSNYTSSQAVASLGYRKSNWFGDVRYTYSQFQNDDKFLEYDNSHWYTPTDATSGSRRGLWESGRVSQPPENDAWNLALTGGFDFAGNSRITAMYNKGEHSQDDLFAPITTNPALIGTVDLNGDGVVDARDDPTTTDVFSQSNLDAKADVTVIDLTFTSRPVDWARFNAKWRKYDYDEGSSSLVIPGRSEYIESHMKTDFKGTSLAWVPYVYDKETAKIEGVFDVKDFRIVAFYDRLAYSWNQYNSTSGNVSREEGNRSVSGTDDDTLGLRLLWKGSERFGARLEYYGSKRDFSGDYQIGFSGVNEGVRQYDIAKRDRTAWEARLDYYANDKVSVGFEYRDWEDDYNESEYGYLDGSENGYTLDLNWMLTDSTNLFLYVEGTSAETNSHLRTKCANCAPPPGADWTAPWNVPNFDWFTGYKDDTFAFGGELSYRTADNKNKFDLRFDVLDGKVQQTGQNPGVPRDLSRPGLPVAGVALAVDFPDQTNDLSSVELRYTRKATEVISWGAMVLYEAWNMDDFQLESMDPYGANFLTVDDATRMMFLDSWVGDYEATIGQLFMKFNF